MATDDFAMPFDAGDNTSECIVGLDGVSLMR